MYERKEKEKAGQEGGEEGSTHKYRKQLVGEFKECTFFQLFCNV